MLVQFTRNFGDSHLAGNGGLGEQVTVKTVMDTATMILLAIDMTLKKMMR